MQGATASRRARRSRALQQKSAAKKSPPGEPSGLEKTAEESN